MVRLYLPAGGLMLLLGPWTLLAAWMADRSVMLPKVSCPVARLAAMVSAKLFTVKTAGAMRSSRVSRWGVQRGRRDRQRAAAWLAGFVTRVDHQERNMSTFALKKAR